MSHELRAALDRVARKIRGKRLWDFLAICWMGWAVVGLGLFAIGPLPTGLVVGASVVALATALACIPLAMRPERDPRRIAGRIETAHADLNAVLLTAVEEDIASSTKPRGYLQQTVIDRALAHGRSHDWSAAVVPEKTLAVARFRHAGALCLALAAFALLFGESRRLDDHSWLRKGSLAGSSDVQVLPGDAEIERGSSLLVVARFGGIVPPDAKLVVERAPEPSASRPMIRSLEDPAFAGRVETVDEDLSYHVDYGDARTPSYRIRVFENPELTRADAKLVYPGYTALAPKLVEDIRHVTAVEGTELALTLRLNKDVASAILVDEKGKETPLTTSGEESTVRVAALTLADTHRYKVRLVDREGRRNKLPAEIGVNVTKNRPPTIAMNLPGHDVRVSPIEELGVKAQIADDYGVTRHGLSHTHAGGEPRETVLGVDGPDPVKKVQAEHVIDLESLHATPDQLVSYFLWAEDVGPDGKPRRTEGDMYFAEVRHFEEIFRQGEQPTSASSEQEQQEGGNAQEAEQLAELQKQIVNGTWKVIRRETIAQPSATFAADVTLLQESQKSAVEQAEALGEKLRDQASKESLQAALKAMNEASKLLGNAVASKTPGSLKPALAAEQAAYQALLKLRAREFEVVRRNSRQQRSSRSASASASQRQLNQLELSNEKDRFEEQSRAKPEPLTQKEQEQRETRQVVNRLRELARRQADLNERLKELQSALEAEDDEPAKQELERQLKRLRDQQQEILRDTDELQQRMEQEQNRERMAEARQQVEQGREHVRQASEALEQGRLSQALTEGTRAGRQLDEVRDDLRKESSNQFTEEMTELREQARKLDESQEKLTEQIDAWKGRAERTLRDPDDKKEIEQGLDRQAEDLDQLLERMRNTTRDAEETEPRLASSLYDAARKADEQAISETLREAEQMAQAGIPEEAARSSERAGQGVKQLREGVDRAARSVLGDETAALRRAEAEVDDLARQLDREIGMATGDDRQPSNRPYGDRPRPQEDPEDPSGQGERSQGQPGNEPRQGDRPGQPGQEPGREPGQRPGEGANPGQPDGQGQAQGQPQPGQSGAGRPKGEQDGLAGQGGQGEGQQPGQPEGQPGQGGQGQGRQGRGGRGRSAGDRLLDGLAQGPAGPGGPITGEGFRQWSDRMREVEELLEAPALRADAARIRDRVRGAREDFKRHAKEPDWSQLKVLVAEPIRELRDRIAEEVRRRDAPDSLVPIDRDPVPPRFAEGVRRYYERLGSGR